MKSEQDRAQAWRQAQQQHARGEWDAAESAYRGFLNLPERAAEARHWLGFLLLQRDRPAEALPLLIEAVERDGSHPEWHFNLGLAHARLEQAAAAAAALTVAVERSPRQYYYWTNLAAQLTALRRYADAERACRQALALDEDCPDGHYLLSAALRAQGRHAEARRSNARGVLAEAEGRLPPIVRAQAYCDLGRRDEAQALARAWLAQEPGHPVAEHLSRAFADAGAAEGCSVAYVEYVFDAEAERFDRNLGRLRYAGPALVADYLAAHPLADGAAALDLGCGTGLIGAALRGRVARLTGVDLSAGMLRQARARQCYDALHRAELRAHLRADRACYALICCMDTLIYLGELDEALALMAARLSADGVLLFSTERLDDGGGQAYRLDASGRYRHSPAYLAEALAGAGLQAETMRDAAIREEAGSPVPGQFVAARRAG
ncbi:hypothetical protein CEK28_11950 [Xenophilus sp. AP218F]|nr:methyltransferase domain-containing protein [Chromobacterium sp. ASV5]OWY38795.1 hypothetical protein CEK28_11950 [Xenophilus sp. AP218F]